MTLTTKRKYRVSKMMFLVTCPKLKYGFPNKCVCVCAREVKDLFNLSVRELANVKAVQRPLEELRFIKSAWKDMLK